MKNMRRFLSLLVVLCMLLTAAPATVFATTQETVAPNANAYMPSAETEEESEIKAIESPFADYVQALNESKPETAVDGAVTIEPLNGLDLNLMQNLEINQNTATLEQEVIDENELVKVIVVLEERSLLQRGFTTAQIASATGAAQSATRAISRTQDAVMEDIQSVVGDKAQVTEKYRYNIAISGISVVVPYGSLEEIKAIKGVKTAFVAPCYALPEDMTAADAQPNQDSATNLSGAVQTWNTLGYNGEGMRIAIIDTGLDLDHPSFVDAPDLTEDSLTLEEVNSVLTTLNAYELYGSALTAAQLYRSEKVPFGFNYVDSSLDVTHDNDQQGYHGSHVAGIAAANDIETTDVVGMAPEAQLVIMKVFGLNGGAYFDDILAALEDCYRLNVDAVNMSLGSSAGFSSEDETVDAIFSQILESDMILSISAGNESSAAYGNAYGTNLNFASDPDNGIVGSPGTYVGATTVASAENTQTRMNYFTVGEAKIGYNDVSLYSFALNYGGETMEYIMVPGLGDVTDYEGLDVSGKIAVVERGTLDFTVKQQNAYDAGAWGLIVYDNVEGELISMVDAELLPNAFITKADGAVMAAAADENGVGTMTFGPLSDMIPIVNPLAGTMSAFSSLGVTPDLQLEPDITAYGGNIYSCYSDGEYGMMSGTSMSAPAIAGMSALVLQYLREEHPDLTDAQKHTVAEALLMSTATAIVDPTNATVHYSPRKQGAGNANVYNALISPAYLTVNGSTPKVSLGDDDAKAGVYTFSFEVTNMSDAALVYTIDGYAMTDKINLDYADYGLLFMGETGQKLGAPVTFAVAGEALDKVYDLNEDGTVDLADVQLLLDMTNSVAEVTDLAKADFDLNEDGTLDTVDAQILYEMVSNNQVQLEKIEIPAGKTVTVTATVTLTDEDKAYMDAYYENGIYVEGFVTLTAASEGAVDLSLPYMGFYGDWSAARIFDSGWWFQEDTELDYMRYPHVVFTQFMGDDYGYNLGLNPYFNEAYDPYHNVLSPNGDGNGDYIGEIYLGMMRNAKKLDFTWEIYNENGELVDTIVENAEYARKSSYYSYYGVCIPYMYANDFGNADEITAGLPDGYRVELSIDGYLDDGDDVLDESLTVPINGEVYDSIPIYIDNTAPVVIDDDVNYWYNEADDERRIEFLVQDNHAIAAIATLTQAGQIIDMFAVEDTTEPTLISIDVSNYDETFILAVCDYGANETYYSITFGGAYNVDFDSFYGYRRYAVIPYGSYLYTTDALNGWYSFETADTMLQHTSQYDSGETAVSAAEYVDGYIIGVDVNSKIFAMKAGDWTRSILGTLEIDGDLYTALDMAFDYKNNVMYILTDELSAYRGGHLVKMDYLTGEYEDLGDVYDGNWYDEYDFYQGVTLACDNDGILYTIDYLTGDLYTIDPETTSANYVGSTGYVPQNNQSMTVDHETNELYWAAYQSYLGDSNFYLVDKTTGELTWVADMEYNCAMTGLFKPYKPAEPLFPDVSEVYALQLSDTALAMAKGNTKELLCKQLPYYAEQMPMVWTSSDEAVVTVENGVVQAVGEGEAVITVTAGELTAECAVAVYEFTDELYAFDMGTTGLWISFPAATPGDIVTYDDAIMTTMGFTSAAYHDGWVYASEYDGSFYRLDPETLQGSKLGSSGGPLMGMAFNYTDGFMYGVKMTSSWWEQSFELVRVNLSSGAVQVVQTLDAYTYGSAILCSLAIDLDGNFYFYSMDAYAYEPQLLKCALTTDESGAEYLTILDIASMTQYPNYGFGALHYSMSNGGLYLTTDTGELFWLKVDDMSNVQVVNLGIVGYESSWPQILGIYTIPAVEPEAPYVAPERAILPESYMVLEGGSISAGLTVEPWNATADATYTTADTSIATVDEYGLITGVAAGSTTLTVAIEAMNFTKSIPVTVAQSTGNIYGYLVSDFSYGSDIWMSFADSNPAAPTADGYGDGYFSLYAGAYYNGKVYGVGQDQLGTYNYKNYFVKVDTATYATEALALVESNIRDMAFDYTTGTLYGISEGGTHTGTVVQFNTQTGEMTAIAETGKIFAAMTIDADGQMYGICQTDDCLYAIDKATGATTLIGSTGVDAGQLYQSMVFDVETGNIYWAQAADDQTSSLRLVDTTSGLSTGLGLIGPYGSMVSCLYTETQNEPKVPETVVPNGIVLTEKAFVVTGSSAALSATVLPVSVANVDQKITWTTSNAAVATVADGVVTGVAAGTATITATNANGDTATCVVTVSDTERSFYAYDRTNAQWISFAGSDTTKVTVQRADAEGEAALLGAAYTGTTLYAYDVNGEFYTVNTTTFERTKVGTGIKDQTLSIEATDWWGETYTMECTLEIIDLSYDEATGKLYAALLAKDEYGWSAGSVIGEVNLADGTVTSVYYSDEVQPGNLLVINGKAFFVDTYMTGMLTVIDLNAEVKTYAQQSLVYGYWGDVGSSASFIMDSYTGTVYVVRDMVDTWDEEWEAEQFGEATLYTMSLGNAGLTPTTEDEALIGEGIMVCGLFLK